MSQANLQSSIQEKSKYMTSFQFQRNSSKQIKEKMLLMRLKVRDKKSPPFS